MNPGDAPETAGRSASVTGRSESVTGRSVLVTGANGFIGAALMRRLLDDRVDAVGAVRRPSGNPREHLAPSLSADADWRPLLAGCRTVIHVAARAHVADRDLERFREVNVMGTLRLAEQAAAAGVERFILLSSIGVNGNESGRPFTEDDVPKPAEAYAISKLEAETGLKGIAARSAMQWVIVRPPLVYGHRAPGNFARLLRALERGWPLPLGAIRENRRTLIGLDNLVDFLVTCIDHPAAGNRLFLVGDAEDLSTTELLRRLASACEIEARLLPVPAPLLRSALRLIGKGDLAQRLCGNLQIDSSRASGTLGWTPPVSVDEGLRRAAGVRAGKTGVRPRFL